MALGSGSTTPMQMVAAYSVFANGGYLVTPWLIQKITDERGKTLVEVLPKDIQESQRVIDARNAFVMTSLLQEVTRSGTGAAAQATLKRSDIYGKTGTTNDSHDAWFNGFNPTVTAVTWIGYDNPKNLGDHETGGGLSLPVWISFMQTALKGVPISEIQPPEGVVNRGSEWFYDEYNKGSGVTTLGVDGNHSNANASSIAAPPQTAPAAKPNSDQERKSILDLFRN